MFIFTIPDIVGNIINFIGVLDIISISRVNRLFKEKSTGPPMDWIKLQRDRLSTLQKLYIANTKPATLISLGYMSLPTKKKSDIVLYSKFTLPEEYLLILQMLNFYNIPTINVVDYNTIEKSLNRWTKKGDNAIPLFYILDIVPCLGGLRYAESKVTMSSGDYLAYLPIAVEDPCSDYDRECMSTFYGLSDGPIHPFLIVNLRGKSISQCWGKLLYNVYIDAVHTANFKHNDQYYNTYDNDNIIDIKLQTNLELFAQDN